MFERGGRLLTFGGRVPVLFLGRKSASKPRRKAVNKPEVTRLALAKKRALLLLPIWLASLFWTWVWWFHSVQIELPWLYIFLTAALFYQFAILPSAYLLLVLSAKNPPKRKLLTGKKVAVITPCVPSQESIEIIERQLKAMSQITYPHDSWILDESNSKVIKKLAKKYGVRHFSRKGVGKYNQDIYPFKTRTKAGNVNAWIDHVKRRKYDFFVQLDTDHAPKPEYLDKTLGHFRDARVGWVQAPSVYSNTNNWIARGAAELELAYQGPIQMGYYGLAETPMVVGSHCAYRMSAINEIGGFQPTRAEDHLDTVAMVSKGWKGVYIPEIIAEGEGPETFGDFLTQQFAWAYSMFQVVMKHSPKHIIKIRSVKKLIPIFFSETYFPLWALSYTTTFFVPLIALSINRNVVDVKWTDIALRLVPSLLVILLVWLSGRSLMHSKGIRLSWRGILLEIIRWPSLLIAVLNALLNVKKPYMVTPKGQQPVDAPPARIYLPFFILSLMCSLALLGASLKYGILATTGQMVFVLFNTAVLASVCLLDLNITLRTERRKIHKPSFGWLRPIGLMAVMLVFFATSIVTSPLIQKSAVSAFSKPVPDALQLDPSLMPVWKLSNQELLQQISTYRKPSNAPAPDVGIFDPVHNYVAGSPYIRHSFIDWRNSTQVGEEILRSERYNAVPMITIEPAGYKNGAALLRGIANGEYDNYLKSINTYLKQANEPVYVRFAHEMDLPGAFPWSTQNPRLYIAAYRHVVNLGRATNNPNLKWVWSPGGIQGVAGTYYPGDNYVDVVGTTLLYDRFWSGDFLPNFDQLSHTRTWMVAQYNKPIWVTEFGAGNANPVFQKWLIQESVANFKKFGFSALVYINIDDPHLKIPNYTYNNSQELRNLLGIKTPKQPLSWMNSAPKSPIIVTSNDEATVYSLVASRWHNINLSRSPKPQQQPINMDLSENRTWKISNNQTNTQPDNQVYKIKTINYKPSSTNSYLGRLFSHIQSWISRPGSRQKTEQLANTFQDIKSL